RIEILIGSDGSSDRTEEIVRKHAADGAGLISFPQQIGKSAVQNGLVAAASGEILVFTDADCFLPPEALRSLIHNFGDPRVGLVTARPLYENESATCITQNESMYLRYESWLRREESDRGLLAMASGSLFALRRALWRPLDANLGDDFVLPLEVLRAGYRNVLEPRAVALTLIEQKEPASMLRLKTRIISKDFRGLLAHSDLLNPLRFGGASLALWSHKLLRWLVPYFLLGLFAASILLSRAPFFRVALLLQCVFYALALAGLLFRERLSVSRWTIPFSFCLVNFAALLGTLQCFAGRTSGQWKPVRKQTHAA
ncbi:MAG: glycosyltransferase, partial [Candidatus Acidiferrales bacterium]